MPRCLHCGRPLRHEHDPCLACGEHSVESHQFSGPLTEDSSVDARDSLVVIARFTNAAEAGYFAHELTEKTGQQITVRMDENFDAMSGFWSTKFVIATPRSVAARVTSALETLIEESGGDEIVERDDEYSSDSAAPVSESHAKDSGVNWVPIVLTLTAGSVAFWGVKTVHEQWNARKVAAGMRGQGEGLWESLSRSPDPWVQESTDGHGRRELSVDAERNTAILREDADGDGIYERQVRFIREEAD